MDLNTWVKMKKSDSDYMKLLKQFIKDPERIPTKREKIMLGMTADFRVWNNKDRTLKEIIELFI